MVVVVVVVVVGGSSSSSSSSSSSTYYLPFYYLPLTAYYVLPTPYFFLLPTFLHPACKSLCWEPNEGLEQTLKPAMPLIGHNFKGCSSGHLQKPFCRSGNDCKF